MCGENYIMRSLIICTAQKTLFGWSNREWNWVGGHVELYKEFWWGNLRERDHLEDLGVDGRIILNGSSGSGMWGYGLDWSGSG
jgi:hypothetical protein